MKKMKSALKAILISLISCIIFALFLESPTQIAKNLGKGVFNAFIDYFYYSCGRVDNVYFISYLVFLAFLMYMIKDLRDFIKLYRSIFMHNEKSLDAEERAKVEQYGLDVIIEEAIKTEQEKRKLEWQERIIKALSWFVILCQIVVLCYISVYMYMPAVKNRLFEQKIVQITPYTESEKIDILKSDWVSMESKNDYDKIMVEINSIVAEIDLK